jgi:hypothetical protein
LADRENYVGERYFFFERLAFEPAPHPNCGFTLGFPIRLIFLRAIRAQFNEYEFNSKSRGAGSPASRHPWCE